jgi:hypothetical protein
LSADLFARIRERYDLIRSPAAEVYGVPRLDPRDPDAPRHIVATPAQTAADAAGYVLEVRGEIPSQADATAALSLVDIVAATAPLREVALRMAHTAEVTYLDRLEHGIAVGDQALGNVPADSGTALNRPDPIRVLTAGGEHLR